MLTMKDDLTRQKTQLNSLPNGISGQNLWYHSGSINGSLVKNAPNSSLFDALRQGCDYPQSEA